MQLPTKDADRELPIADAWKPTFREIVRALAEGDYSLSRGIAGVELRTPDTAEQMRGYIASYGETLAVLPEASWETSVSMWMRSFWEVFVDLWTVESGASDLVLSARVYAAGDGYRYEVSSVYVP